MLLEPNHCRTSDECEETKEREKLITERIKEILRREMHCDESANVLQCRSDVSKMVVANESRLLAAASTGEIYVPMPGGVDFLAGLRGLGKKTGPLAVGSAEAAFILMLIATPSNIFETSHEDDDVAGPRIKGFLNATGANTTSGNPDPNEGDDGDKPKGKSVNQINNDVKKGKAPDGIKRADTGKVTGEQDHVHLDNGNALNRDGTWKHLKSDEGLTRAQEKYLSSSGWTLPK